MKVWPTLLLLPCVACFSPDDPPAGSGTDDGSSGGTSSASESSATGSGTTSSTTMSTSSPQTSSTSADPDTTVTAADDTSTSTGGGEESTTGSPAACGNGLAEPGELCFDGAPILFEPVNAVQAIAVGDMDGNGHLDLVTSEGEDAEAAFYFGAGNGNFGGYAGDAFSPTTVDVATGHFNLDDDIDAVWGYDTNGPAVGVLLSDGAGTFTTPFANYGDFRGTAVAAGDIDGDGLDDVVSVGTIFGGGITNGLVATFFSAADGTLGSPTTAQHPNAVYNDVLVAEFTGNDSPDVAFLFNANTSSSLRVCRGNGSGQFSNNVCETIPAGTIAPKLAAGDFDDDGNVDIIVTELMGNDPRVYPGMGNGTFDAPIELPLGVGTLGVATGDLDNDGVSDAVMTTVEGATVIFRGGAFTLEPPLTFPDAMNCQPRDVALGDFNEDGALDIAVPCSDYPAGEATIVVFNSDV